MQKIIPHLWFNKEAAAAAEFYASIFKDSKIINKTLLHNTPSGTVEIINAEFAGTKFVLLSAGPLFKFNEAISFMVPCETQDEIDYYWERLSANPGAEQCGWLKDKYGLSWQIVPTVLDAMLQDQDEKRVARVTETFLKMKKLDIAQLKAVYEAEAEPH